MTLQPPSNRIPFITKTGQLSPEGLRFLQDVVDRINGTTTSGVVGVELINGSMLYQSTGSPNGAVTGSPGDLYINGSGGASTTLWVKETGTSTNTGWVGK